MIKPANLVVENGEYPLQHQNNYETQKSVHMYINIFALFSLWFPQVYPGFGVSARSS